MDRNTLPLAGLTAALLLLSALPLGAACASSASAAQAMQEGQPGRDGRADADAGWPGELAGGPRLRFGDPEPSTWDAPFFPGSRHDPDLPTPDELLGQPVGTRMVSHDELLAALRLWAERSERLTVVPYGETHEGRELVLCILAGERHRPRLEEIRALQRRLAGFDGDVAEPNLPADHPAIAWMGYGIHGDEASATDAALALVWHLAAGVSEDVTALLDEVVVIVDPCLNPDGRERIHAELRLFTGREPVLDHQSAQRVRWPQGRGNHYLFDMNRDWLAGVAPETRARWRAMTAWLPHLLVDGHEMWALDTFLFYPQAAAHNPELPASLGAWHGRFAADAAVAFDQRGWSYYTREWADAWAPFYTDAWGALNGAVSMLYEQARGHGMAVRRASGEVVSYRESVHRQVAISLANLETLRRERAAVQRDWLAARRESLDGEHEANRWSFYAAADGEPERLALLAEMLTTQGIEVEVLAEAIELEDARPALPAAANGSAAARGEQNEGAEETSPAAGPRLGPGALVVRARQPQGRLVRAALDFDPRLPDEYLAEERGELERKGESKIYDSTAWSLAHALGLEAHWARPTAAATRPAAGAAGFAAARAGLGLSLPDAGRVHGDAQEPPVAWAVDGSLDGSVRFAARALEAGLAVHRADRAFRAGGKHFPAGSLLVRRHENRSRGADLDGRVARAAREARAEVHALGTFRSPDEGPDLGGGHFHLLERPRVALLTGAPTAPEAFGHLWHHLDRRLGLPYTLLDAQSFGAYDLRRYNVLVLPPARGDLGALLAREREALAAWVEAGGTLVALGNAAVALADAELELTSARELGAALDQAAALRAAARRELSAGRGGWDFAGLWEGTLPSAEGGFEAEGDEAPPGAEARDRWLRRFAPAGVYLRAHLDGEHWLTAGLAQELAVPYSGAHALFARLPAASPARLAEGPGLRVAGLLWPEARERLELASWAVVEPRGAGQVVLLAADPVFRGIHLGSARLLSHALVYGPGQGATAPVPR